ncbi:hypothetical protein J6Z19_00925 [bacterium]|nr:hypothetical protein [bacterium]
MKKFFLLLTALLLFSCSTVPHKTVDENGNYNWKSETFEMNPQNQAFSAEGDVTMWVDVEQYKGKFSGDYQILSASPEKWRMIITGPFNISVATVVINGENSYIFHEGVWDSAPWREISKQLFNAPVDGDVFSVMLGGRFKFEGECAAIGIGSKLCRKNGIYYKISKGRVVEIISGDLYIVSETTLVTTGKKKKRTGTPKKNRPTLKNGLRWTGVANGKNAFIFENSSINSKAVLDDSLFAPPAADEKDEFDEL